MNSQQLYILLCVFHEADIRDTISLIWLIDYGYVTEEGHCTAKGVQAIESATKCVS